MTPSNKSTGTPMGPVGRGMPKVSPQLGNLGGGGAVGQESEEARKAREERRLARERAVHRVGNWIYLNKPDEEVRKAMELLSVPQFPDGRYTQYDPNENQAMTESGGP